MKAKENPVKYQINNVEEYWYIALISLGHWASFPLDIEDDSLVKFDFNVSMSKLDMHIIAKSYYKMINLAKVKV
uniref:Uncharacterized protein n=1 Tax=Trichobilharzia regenti TaxID=157069 RepID=A0AA85K1I5_TRIRE|nr:unnamed protein product [Trichobilharzia regenti]